MTWLERNYNSIVRVTYIVPILLVAAISVSHVIDWYGLTNPASWAIYLSVAIEIAALGALAGMNVKNVTKFVYVPFIIVTLIQLVGNIFFAYKYSGIDVAKLTEWIELINPLFESMGLVGGVNDIIGHRRALAYVGGGLLPLISLSFMELLVRFNKKLGGNDEAPEDPETATPTEPTEEVDLYEAKEQLKGEPLTFKGPRIPVVELDTEIKYHSPDNVKPDTEPYLKEIIEKFKRTPTLNPIVTKTEEIELPQEPEPEAEVEVESAEMELEVTPEAEEISEKIIEETPEFVEEPIEEVVEKIEEVIEETETPVAPAPIAEGDIAYEDIKEIKEKRGFSRDIPVKKDKSSISRIGDNKVVNSLRPDTIVFKRGEQ
jgi:hypothetical protein|tara:strand:+ start:23629 stop:24750 length:1122 start_codon:yes stop_codon:yes gene_type:complete